MLAAPARPLREVRVVMGTTAEVHASGASEAALAAAFAALERVDASMSLWKPSELQELNGTGRAQVSPDLATVLRHALEVAWASGGAFDPTVEPLVRAAGHLGGRPRRLGCRERRRLLRRVGAARVHLDPASRLVSLDPGTRLDLGGLAKGHAVDLAVAAMKDAGASSGLIDLGGSSIAAFGQELTIEVRDPDGGTAPWGVFSVACGAVGSAGSDQRRGHILDPRTGRPARGVMAATVVAATALEADALDTAVFVLGAESGLDLLRRRGAAGFVLVQEKGRRTIRATAGFAARYGLKAAPGIEVRE